MANVKGLQIPVGVGPTGRTVIVSDDAQSKKIIRIALSDGENDNAFQQNITLGEGHVFAVNSPRDRAIVLSRLLRIFADFQDRDLYKLQRETIRWEKGPAAGEQTLSFKYIDLETDKVQDFSRTYGSGGAS